MVNTSLSEKINMAEKQYEQLSILQVKLIEKDDDRSIKKIEAMVFYKKKQLNALYKQQEETRLC